MKITLKDLREASLVLDKILGAPIDFKSFYRIKKISVKMLSVFTTVEAYRVKLVEQLGEIQPDGTYAVLSEKNAVFQKEFNKYLEEEIDLGIQLIPADLIAKIVDATPTAGTKCPRCQMEIEKPLTFSAYDLAILDRFIEPETAEKVIPDKKEK